MSKKKLTPTGLVLMTALPPTYGHKALIDFARNFMVQIGGKVEVILNSRSIEPLDGRIRWQALDDQYQDDYNVWIRHCNEDSVPQNPSDHPDFWNIWKTLIEKNVDQKVTHVFTSETYGIELAKTLDATFIPFDIDRTMVEIKATRVRNDPLDNFDYMLPGIQDHYRKTITLFGPESCGKTTLTNASFFDWEAVKVPEWARTYLELVGPEITDEKMLNIVYGQYAAQMVAKTITGKPFIVQDTDLLSTLGYYKLWKGSWPSVVEDLFMQSKSDLYVLMNDKIPFTPDPLRYGGDHRETNNQFWIDLLEQFDCNYYVVSNEVMALQSMEIKEKACECFFKTFTLNNFKRE